MTNSISHYVPVVPTSVPNVFATDKGYPLAERFLSCPAAARLLGTERFIKPMLIDIENMPGAETRIHREDGTQSVVEILIPEKYQTTKALRTLAFEIFNAQRDLKETSVYQQAGLGNLGMDAYARRLEKIEGANTKKHYPLLKKCAKHWKMSPEEIKTYTINENQHPELRLFIQEVACHTDFFRQEWVHKFQKIYCDKHPEDSRSCKTKLTDLCDLKTVNSMPEPEKTAFTRDRVCKLLPQAHVAVKTDPSIRELIGDKCPKALANTPQPKQEEL